MKTLPSDSCLSAPTLACVLLLTAACGGGDGDGGTGMNTNNNPVAVIAASPLEVPVNDGNQTVVTLDGSGSSDADNDPLSFAWVVPNGTFVNSTSATSTIPQVTFPGTAPYNVTLTVTDGRGGSGQAAVTIGLASGPVNQAPTAVATANPTTVPTNDGNNTVVTLTGTASSDPENDPLTFLWNVPSGTFVGGTSATSPVAEVTFPGTGAYVVTLTVDDGQGNQDTATVTIAPS